MLSATPPCTRWRGVAYGVAGAVLIGLAACEPPPAAVTAGPSTPGAATTAPASRPTVRHSLPSDRTETQPIGAIQPEHAFDQSVEGVARTFMFGWVGANRAMLLNSMMPVERVDEMLSYSFSDPIARMNMLEQIIHEPPREFRAGDEFPMTGPDGASRMVPVTGAGLDEDHRLLMVADRGLYLVRTPEGWRVDAEPVLRALTALRSTLATQPTSGPTSRTTFVPMPEKGMILEVIPRDQKKE